MAVREWEGEVVFLHEVVPGAADRSYGIQVARLAGLPETVLSRARQVLGVLESRSSGNSAPMLDDLPLFAAAPAAKKPEINPLNDMLDQVRPDELSPREALDLIYELKKARDAGRRS
jgi:DNA mismatch repair protein MutS